MATFSGVRRSGNFCDSRQLEWQLFVGVVAVAIFVIPVRLNNPASSVLHGLHGHVSGLL